MSSPLKTALTGLTEKALNATLRNPALKSVPGKIRNSLTWNAVVFCASTLAAKALTPKAALMVANGVLVVAATWILAFAAGRADAEAELRPVIADLGQSVIQAAAHTAPVLTGPVPGLVLPSARPVPRPVLAAKEPYGDDRLCLAFNIFHEGRDQPETGRILIGQVTQNRVGMRASWGTMCDTIFAPWQYSWTHESPYIDLSNPIERQALRDAFLLADRLIDGRVPDISRGATHYFNPKKADPAWKTAFQQIGFPKRDAGDHLFFR